MYVIPAVFGTLFFSNTEAFFGYTQEMAGEKKRENGMSFFLYTFHFRLLEHTINQITV